MVSELRLQIRDLRSGELGLHRACRRTSEAIRQSEGGSISAAAETDMRARSITASLCEPSNCKTPKGSYSTAELLYEGAVVHVFSAAPCPRLPGFKSQGISTAVAAPVTPREDQSNFSYRVLLLIEYCSCEGLVDY